MQKKSMLRAFCVILAAVMTLSAFPFTAGAEETQKVNGAEAIIATALAEEGYTEGAGEYTKYGAYFNYQGAWCGAFVSWCARVTGIPQDVIPTNLSSTAMRDYFKGQGLYYLSKSYGGSYTPKTGDIVFFTDYNPGGRSANNICHIGLVVSATASYVTCIEGNARNAVVKRDRGYTNYIVGFATPKYEGVDLNAPSAESPYKAGTYVTDSEMNFRTTPNGTVITTIPKGTAVEVTAIEGVWGKIVYGGRVGWMSLQYSTYKQTTTVPEENETSEEPAPEPAPQPVPENQYRVTSTMNIRASYTESSSIIGSVPAGTLVQVTEVSDGWGKVTYGGVTGWMNLNWSVKFEPEVDWLVIDVSYSQSPDDLDWIQLKNEGVKGVIIRIGGRGSANGRKIYSDELFLEHYNDAKAAGMHIGVYFFSYALTKAEAIEEAQYTLDVLEINNCQLDLPVYIDMEDYGSDKSHLNAGKAVCSEVLDEFCKTVEEAGYTAGIYCSRSFAETHVEPSVFEGRSTWIAEWDTDVCCYNGNVDMWQYTENGKLKGASNKDIDMNRLYVDYPSKIRTELYENGLILPGDLTFDGDVSAVDSRLALRFAVNLETPSELQQKVGDVDNDGKLSASDAREILKLAVAN